MKRLFFALFVLFPLSVFAMGEMPTDSNEEQTRATEQSMKEMHAQIGMPAIKNFQERKLAKMIFELRDQGDLITYAYLVGEMTGQLVYLGQCIGYGLPYSVQYTNPEKRIGDGIDGEIATIPQADPNGLFMPAGLSATWLMLIDEDSGVPKPVYVEPPIIVSPMKLH